MESTIIPSKTFVRARNGVIFDPPQEVNKTHPIYCQANDELDLLTVCDLSPLGRKITQKHQK